MNYETEDYKIETEEKNGCLLDLKIEIKKKKCETAYKKAIKAINKEISIPGFRKGKVPDEVVIKKYSTHIEKEWKDILLNDAFQAALELTETYPLTKKSIQKTQVEKCSQDGALVRLSYEFYPKVPAIDFTKLSLPPVEVKSVGESEVEEILKEIQESQSQWEDVTGRSVEEEDFVELSITTVEDEKSIVKERRFHLAEKKISAWLKNLVLGRKVGEVVEGETALDETASAATKASFKPVKVRVHIHAIKKPLLPPIDDNFAIKAGASSLEDLKKQIRKDLSREHEEATREIRYNALREALLKSTSFELPSSLLASEIKERHDAKLQELKQKNLSAEESQSQEKEIEASVKMEAEKSVRLYFINRQLARQGNITVSREEINEELNSKVFVKKEEITEELLSRVSNFIFQQKLKDYSLSQIENS